MEECLNQRKHFSCAAGVSTKTSRVIEALHIVSRAYSGTARGSPQGRRAGRGGPGGADSGPDGDGVGRGTADNYVYLIPFVEDEDCFFLRTIIPSRKATRDYLRERLS
jgi:hypothetical protein